MSGTFHTADATRPASNAVELTASDATVFPTTRALYIGTGGTLAVAMAADGSQVSFTNVANGTILPVQVIQVRATGTTATGVIALY